MHDALLGVEAKLDRASAHLDAIKTVLREYLGKNPYSLKGDVDMQGRGPIEMSVETPPYELATIAGDCLHNLRSALDHLAWELVKVSGNTPDRGTFFPIVDVAPPPDRQIPPGVTPQIQQLLAPIHPYNWEESSSSHPLYVLHALNNIDKHRMLTFGGYSLSHTYLITGAGAGEWKTIRLLEDGAELGLIDEVDMEVKGKLTMRICFRETGPGTEPRPIVVGLSQILLFIREHVLGPIERDVFVRG